ncbi:tetratricopeptide repeat protein 23-like isoform X2 [Anneissia japonica]|uniref:tetratricopeptide repeat protein 23-like isoform X2 n=1 Tax=Anneissia japonica TaxID=1529436 RepID=UPI001425A4BC|nr:tetratricopeptide repeat protein 23-like isoform X2 [Anneissia japonica]XP_033124204.1 tetratricopeptide repeat protein 23-like isoform X2 [Anneissia japonica]
MSFSDSFESDESSGEKSGTHDEEEEDHLDQKDTSSVWSDDASMLSSEYGSEGTLESGYQKGSPEDRLHMTQKYAKKFTAKNKVNLAMTEWIRCTALARLVYGDGHWKLAHSHASLGQAYLELRELAPQAEHHATLAKNMLLKEAHSTNSTEDKAGLLLALITTYYTLGRACTILKKYPQAEQNLAKAERSCEERRKLYNQNDLDIKVTLALARLCASQGRHSPGFTYFEKALKLIEEDSGSGSSQLVPVYQDMGRLEQSKKDKADHDRAVEYFLQAHSIASSNSKRPQELTGQTAHQLALAYAKSGTSEAETAAERYLEESLGTYSVVHGEHHTNSIEVQEELCKLLIRTQRTDEAIELLKCIISAKCTVYGELSEEVGESYKLYGSLLMSQGNLDKSLTYFKKCHGIKCNLYGSQHRKTQAIQSTIDMLLQSPLLAAKEGKSKSAQLKARPRFTSTVGRSSPRTSNPIDY